MPIENSVEKLIMDFGKEVIMMAMTAGFSWLLHHLQKIIKDLNAYFDRVRALEARVVLLEAQLQQRPPIPAAANKDDHTCKVS